MINIIRRTLNIYVVRKYKIKNNYDALLKNDACADCKQGINFVWPKETDEQIRGKSRWPKAK